MNMVLEFGTIVGCSRHIFSSLGKTTLGLAIAVAAFAAAGGGASAQCEAPASVRGLSDGLPLLATPVEVEQRQAALVKALAENPDNYFVLRAQMFAMEDVDRRIQWATGLQAQHPDSPIYALLAVQALLGQDTPEAMRRLETLQGLHPEMPEPYLILADLLKDGRFRDKGRAQKALENYEELCPRSTSISFLDALLQVGPPDLAVRTEAYLRSELMADKGPIPHDKWQALWKLEFQVHPVSEHPELRNRIAADLARFEKADARRTVAWLLFLRGGYQSLGDTLAAERLNDELVLSFPQSGAAKRVVQGRWKQEHPRAVGLRPDEAYTRELLAAAQEWHKRWPADPAFARDILTALNDLPDSTPEQVTKAADELLATYRDHAHAAALFPLVPLIVAETYVRRQIRMDQVPELVRQSAAGRQEHNEIDDRLDERTQQMIRLGLQGVRLRELQTLLDCYASTGERKGLQEIDSELGKMEITESSPKARVLSMRARIAEIEERKLDALALYRGAIAARTALPAGGSDALEVNTQRLWRELGGSPDLYAMLGETPKPAEAADPRWQRPKNRLPDFSLSDLEGNTWKLASLSGKVVLINVWATWCAPCVAEHRELQKLYEDAKGSDNLAVLSFNVDQDRGKVAPYIASHHYTFPVLWAKDLVDAVEPSMGIPGSWIVDPNGQLQWEHVGYGPGWEQLIRAKIQEVRAGNG